MAPSVGCKSKKKGVRTTRNDRKDDAPASETPSQSHHDITSNLGFTVYQPPKKTEPVTGSKWIKVEKATNPPKTSTTMRAPSTRGATGRGRLITLPSRTSPRKPWSTPCIYTIDQQLKGKGSGGLQVCKITSPAKQVQVEGTTAANQEEAESTGIQALRSSPYGKRAQIVGNVAEKCSGHISTHVHPLRSSPWKHVQLQRKILEIPQASQNNLAHDGESNEDTLPPSPNAMDKSGTSVCPSPPKITTKRERTMGKELNKYKVRKIKLPAEIPDTLMRPVGINAQMLITETGCVARGFAPLTVPKWKAINKDERKKLVERVTSCFELDGGEHNIEAVEAEMGRMYRTHKYRLHQHFLKFKSKEEAVRNKPSYVVTDATWKYLCDHFADPAFIKRSAVNRHNRALRKTNHSSGTKSFARVSKELEAELGEKVDRIQLWYETHYHKKTKKWVDANSEDIYNQLLEAKAQSEVEGSSPKTIDEIFDSVLPPKSGYVRGLGPGPKPTRKGQKLGLQGMSAIKELEDKANAAELLNEELQKKVEELQARQDSMQEKMLEVLRAEMRESMLKHIDTPSFLGINTHGEYTVDSSR